MAHAGHGFVTYNLLVYGLVIDICRVKMILYGHFYNSKLLQANGVDPLFCLPRTCRLQQFPGGPLILV